MRLEKYIWIFLWMACATVIGHEFKYFLQSARPERWMMLSWHLGDWLINYQGGFIRRGLMGQFFFWLSDLGIPLKWSVFTLHTVLYLSVFGMVCKLYYMIPRGQNWYIILLSPVFLTFPFHDFLGNSRKENLLFAVFLLFLLFFASKKITTKNVSFILVLYAIGVFSHELMSFAVPFFLYIILRSYELGDIAKKQALLFASGFVVIAATGVLVSLLFHGGPDQATQICDSIVRRGVEPHICDGAINYLRATPQDVHRDIMVVLSAYKFTYPILFILAIAPIFLSTWAKQKRNILFFAITFLALLPLFIVATDWGRWIYILMFIWFSILLAESVRTPIDIKPIPVWLLVLYVTTWGMPHHLNAFDQRFGLVGEIVKGGQSAYRNLK